MITICKQCVTLGESKTTYNLTCQNLDCGVDFISHCSRRKKCYGCDPKRKSYSDKELKEEMCKHNSRSDFKKNSSRHFGQSKEKGWYEDLAREIWGDPLQTGWSRSRFVEACKRNNDGLGILYLIKCFLKDEVFYKVGITSRSVEERYTHDGSKPKGKMAYYYKIIWTIESDGGQIYDLENWFKRETKEIRYQPDLWANKSMETFKCHGNCKILRKPELK